MSDRNSARESAGEPAADTKPDRAEPAVSNGNAALPTPAPMRRAGPYLIGGLVVLVAFLAGVAAWPRLAPHLPEGWRGMNTEGTRLAERIDALEERLAAQASRPTTDLEPLRQAFDGEASARREAIARLERRLKALRQRLDALPVGGEASDQAMERLAARITTLEDQVAEASEADDTVATVADQLTVRNERLAARVKSLEQQVADAAGAAEAVATVQAGLDALDRRLSALEEHIASANAASRRQGLVLAVGQLAAAVAEGRPYADEIERLSALAGEDTELASAVELLAPAAADGVAGLAELRRRFEALAGEIVRAGAGAASDGWLDRAASRLRQLVTVRRTGEVEGGETDAIVARAEVRLADGDLAGALRELEALQGPAAERAEPWQRAAEARLLAERAVARLQARAIELMSQS